VGESDSNSEQSKLERADISRAGARKSVSSMAAASAEPVTEQEPARTVWSDLQTAQEESDLPLLRYSTRLRKQAEKYVPEDLPQPKQVMIPEGRGTALGNIEGVAAQIKKQKVDADVLKNLHKALFGTPGQKLSRKRTIQKWTGHSIETVVFSKTKLAKTQIFLD
jgi:hypothetical protein